MLTMHLEESWDGAQSRHLAPVDGLRIAGRSLRVLPLNVEFLRLSGDQWRNDDCSFSALVIDSRTLIYVQRSRRVKGRFYGPFDRVRLVNGTVQTSIDGRCILGRFNPFDNVWHIYHDESDWPMMVFWPCGS